MEASRICRFIYFSFTNTVYSKFISFYVTMFTIVPTNPLDFDINQNLVEVQYVCLVDRPVAISLDLQLALFYCSTILSSSNLLAMSLIPSHNICCHF